MARICLFHARRIDNVFFQIVRARHNAYCLCSLLLFLNVSLLASTELEIDLVSSVPTNCGRVAGWSLGGDLPFSQSFPYRFSNGVLVFLSFRSVLKRAVRDRFRALCCTEFGH
jgi:hypothetical protein